MNKFENTQHIFPLSLTTVEGSNDEFIKLHIPYGHARFKIMENDEGKAVIIYISDRSVEPGTYSTEVFKDEVHTPIFAIHIETAEQARIWARQFERIAAAYEFRAQKDDGGSENE